MKEWSVKLPNFAQRKTILEEIGKEFVNFPFENVEELATLSDNFNLRSLDLVFKRSNNMITESKEEVLKNIRENIQNIANKTYKSNKFSFFIFIKI